MSVSAPPIHTENLTKHFGRGKKRIEAVRNVHLTVEPGQVYGFLGPNGAGKTTTIRMLLRLLHPTAGRAHIYGQDVERHPEVLRRVGAIVEGASFYNFLSARRNLEVLIAEGKFREDLYHLLAVVPIRVPPLAERREDIPDLVEYFMDQISQATGLPKRRIGDDAMAVLQSHNWPGNVRQLRNNIERLMILAGGDPEAVMSASMLPPDVGSMVPNMPNGNGGEHLMGLPLRDAREVFEREYLVAQISRFGGNISRTAEFVGMERSALHRKLKALGID